MATPKIIELASEKVMQIKEIKRLFILVVYRQKSLVKVIPVSSVTSTRSCSATVLPSPQAEGIEKQYTPKIQKIVEDISSLNLLEVADLNELLKKTLNISETPMMAMGGPVVAQAAKEEDEEEVAPKREKMVFSVKLVKIDDGKKIQLIKQIKALISGMNLVQAKKFVESVPQIVKADLPKDEAEKLKELLVSAGGQVEID